MLSFNYFLLCAITVLLISIGEAKKNKKSKESKGGKSRGQADGCPSKKDEASARKRLDELLSFDDVLEELGIDADSVCASNGTSVGSSSTIDMTTTSTATSASVTITSTPVTTTTEENSSSDVSDKSSSKESRSKESKGSSESGEECPILQEFRDEFAKCRKLARDQIKADARNCTDVDDQAYIDSLFEEILAKLNDTAVNIGLVSIGTTSTLTTSDIGSSSTVSTNSVVTSSEAIVTTTASPSTAGAGAAVIDPDNAPIPSKDAITQSTSSSEDGATSDTGGSDENRGEGTRPTTSRPQIPHPEPPVPDQINMQIILTTICSQAIRYIDPNVLISPSDDTQSWAMDAIFVSYSSLLELLEIDEAAIRTMDDDPSVNVALDRFTAAYFAEMLQTATKLAGDLASGVDIWTVDYMHDLWQSQKNNMQSVAIELGLA